MKKNILLIILTVFMFGCKEGSRTENGPKWEKVANGVWNVQVGTPEKLNLLSELHIQPKIDAINNIKDSEIPISKEDITFRIVDGKTYVRFPLEKDEKIFGLGLNFKTVNQRERNLRLRVHHYEGIDDGRSHAPVPFFVSSKGYGVFINSARYIDVYAGTTVYRDSKNPPVIRDKNTDKEWVANPYSENLEFLIPAEGAELIVFGGPTMLDAVRRYNLYNGGGALPPRWGLGFWQRVHKMYTADDVLKEVNEFEKRDFPLSVIGLEPGWMTRSYPCTFEWDPKRYPDPDKFVKTLNDKHIKTNLWMHAYVSPDGELFDKIKPYTASHTIWGGIVPDFTIPEAKNLMMDHLKKHVFDKGVSGLKMDENDGYGTWFWPDVTTFPSEHTGEQMRQIYASLMEDFTTSYFRERNERTYGLVRAGNAGTNSFPYVLYNDYYDHRDFITALVNSSFIGVLWTPEVRVSYSAEEWLRRMQSVCFSPMAMLNAWFSGTKPWSFEEVNDDVNRIAKLRMQLIPYLYTSFADYAFKGIPPMRAMYLEEGYKNDANKDSTYVKVINKDIKDQFMVGSNMLVAPLFNGEKGRDVILPKGKWYDFYTGEFVGEGEIIHTAPGLSKIPVYVKDGGIIPLWPAITKITDQKLPLEVRHYGNLSSTYSLYDDDGKTFDYEKGKYSRIELKVDVDKEGNKKGTVNIPENNQVWSFSDFKFTFMTK